MTAGLLIILSGPSGVGKGTVCRYLMSIRKNLNLSISTTTRPPRPGEIDGREYNFATESNFNEMVANDLFIEWAEVHGHHYGTSRALVDEVIGRREDLILEIDVQGALQVKEKLPSAVALFLAPPSWAALEERIRGRGTEDGYLIQQRLVTAKKEMEAFHYYDYIVVNDEVEEAAALINSIIDAEKCRVSRGARPPGRGGE